MRLIPLLLAATTVLPLTGCVVRTRHPHAVTRCGPGTHWDNGVCRRNGHGHDHDRDHGRGHGH